jgi:cobalamin biosynthesis protein CobT
MARARRTLDRKTLRDQSEAAERRKKGEEAAETEEEEEDEDEDEDEDDEEAEGEEGEEAEAGGDDDEESGDDDDEDRPKPKKKKVVKPKVVKAPKVTKSRTRTAKVVRMRVMWGVFSNSHQVIEEFDYPHKKDAEELAAKLTADKKSGHPFFLQPIKKPMDKEKEK